MLICLSSHFNQWRLYFSVLFNCQKQSVSTLFYQTFAKTPFLSCDKMVCPLLMWELSSCSFLFMPLVKNCNFLILSILRLCVLYTRSIAINSNMRTVAKAVLTLQMKVLLFFLSGKQKWCNATGFPLYLTYWKTVPNLFSKNYNILKWNYWKN